jgi:hypothetical protein
VLAAAAIGADCDDAAGDLILKLAVRTPPLVGAVARLVVADGFGLSGCVSVAEVLGGGSFDTGAGG